MRRLAPLALALALVPLLTGLSTSQAAVQGSLNGCTSNTPFSGSLTSPVFSLLTASAPQVAFDTWWEIENVNPEVFDLMTVEASADGLNWIELDRLNPDPVPPTDPPTPPGASNHPRSNVGPVQPPAWRAGGPLNLSALAGAAEVQLRFAFDTVDAQHNGFRGWGIDNVVVSDQNLPILGLDFENGIPLDWNTSGFWRTLDAPQQIGIAAAITPPLVTLASGDAGSLPANLPGSTGYAWFGQESTGTFCGEHFDVGLTVDPPAAAQTTGASHSVNVSLANVHASPPSQVLRWTITGANPGSGSAPVAAGAGTVPIAWAGTNEGLDSLEVFLDIDGDQVPGADEPRQTAAVNWAGPTSLSLSPAGASRMVGDTHAVTASATGAVPGSLIQYSVAGPNAVVGTADVNPATGQGTVRWIGANPGHDVVTAYLDIDGDGLQDPGEPSASAEADWTPRQEQGGEPQQAPRTLDDLPDPEPFREVNVQRIGDGPVYVRLPGNSARSSQAGAPPGFVPLEQAAQIPVGSILETSRGRVALESAADPRGLRTQRAQFYSGMFQVAQQRSARPVTELVLKGGSFRGCGSSKGARPAQRRRQGRRVRRIWGDGRGRFRTRGRYSSATVRGTRWVVEDRCNGTLTRVAARPRTNRVEVRDFVARRTRVLRAGQGYFAARR